MENEEKDADLNSKEVPETEVETVEEPEEIEEKPQETPEARKARLLRQLKQVNKKLGVEEEKPKPKKSDEFDHGEKAFLIANGIKGQEEYEFVKQQMEDSGKSLDDIVEAKWFQAELKELRDARVAKNAIPSSSKRSAQSAKDTVEYWLAKGEMPPADQVQLSRDVLNARIKQQKDNSKFSNNPIRQ